MNNNDLILCLLNKEMIMTMTLFLLIFQLYVLIAFKIK